MKNAEELVCLYNTVKEVIPTLEEVQIVKKQDDCITQFRIKLFRSVYNITPIEYKENCYTMIEVDKKDRLSLLFGKVENRKDIFTKDKILRNVPDMEVKQSKGKVLYIPGWLIKKLCKNDEDGLHKYIKSKCSSYKYTPTPKD